MTTADVSTYDGAIEALGQIIQRCATNGDRNGYFAAMYLAVTRTVRQRSAEGHFEDAARMERFVTGFAGRYLRALAAWGEGRTCPAVWRAAFEAATRWRPIILQHLLLGMNAHINLDLGVSASELASGGSIDAVRADFDAVNDVLCELVDGCQEALNEVSPLLRLVDRVGGTNDESILHLSLVAARRQAWSVADRLVPLTGVERSREIERVDAASLGLARVVERPGGPASSVLLTVRLLERAAPGDVMRLLADVRPPVPARVSRWREPRRVSVTVRWARR
jgi:hypothetical protein